MKTYSEVQREEIEKHQLMLKRGSIAFPSTFHTHRTKGQASPYGKHRSRKEENEQDLTKFMEDPTTVPNTEEVVLPKNVNPKKDSGIHLLKEELQPI